MCSMSATTSIQQHFIQAAFLKSWADSTNRVAVAQCIEHRGWHVAGVPKHPNAVAKLRDYFHAGDEMNPAWFEAQFQLIESAGLPVMRRMIAGDMPTGPGNRRKAARYIAMSLLRAYGMREWNRSREDIRPETMLSKPELEHWRALAPAETIARIAREVLTDSDAMRPVRMVDPMSVVYGTCRWALVEAPVGSSFVIGDSFGIRLDNTVRKEPGRNSGMGQSEFLIPLSPYRALVLIHHDESRRWGKGGDDVMQFELIDGEERWSWAPATVLPARVVDLANLCMLAQSRMCLVAHTAGALRRTIQNAAASGQSAHDLRHGVPLFDPIGQCISTQDMR